MARANSIQTEDEAKRIGTLVGTELELLTERTRKQTTSGLSLWRTHHALVSKHGIIITGTLAEIDAALVGIEFVGTEAIVMFSNPVK
jgi:hypothetical protein